MGRKNRTPLNRIPSESHCASGPGLHLGDTWNQKQLQEKYVQELEARYKELNSKKKTTKVQGRPIGSVKSRTSRTAFDPRCSARPNSASSANKPTLVLNDRLNRTAYKEMDESERFFELIRETVTEIVQKKLTEVVDEHFKGVLKRIEEISTRLMSTESSLNTLNNELHNKLNYYGEEHSRHFRYICMKMEYDKIFYQHMHGVLRQEHLNNGFFSCGHSMAQDLLKYPPPFQYQHCPCTCRGNPSKQRDAPKGPSPVPHLPTKVENPANINLHCGDANNVQDKKETSSSQDSQQDMGKSSPELSLKEILASIRQHYPISEDFADKLEKGLWHLEDDQSDRVSSPAHSGQSDDFVQPDIMNVRRVKRIS